MKKLFILTALFVMGGSLEAMAIGNCPTTVSPNLPYQCVTSVYNDSGSDLTSGTVVVWDNDDTEFDRTGLPYVTTSSTADSMWVAGVILDPTCAAGNMCTIVTEGFAWTQVNQFTDAVAEDDLAGNSGVAGQAGGYATGADTCALGMVMELYHKGTGSTNLGDGSVIPIWVDIDCD